MNQKHGLDRRAFLKNSGKAGLIAGLTFTGLPSLAVRVQQKDGYPYADDISYVQQLLPYSYNSLEPVIDATTMELHYSKHAATYAKNLAEAVKAENVDTSKLKLVALLAAISKYSVKMRNNAGGHYNHELFWKLMAPPGSSNTPSGKLLQAIQKDFGSVEAFKTQFADAAKNRFGSGWAWLVLGNDKKLAIGSSANQDNPLMDTAELKGFPVIGLDVWEHAYYLKYQNKRPEYINAWWTVVNWEFAEKRFTQGL